MKPGTAGFSGDLSFLGDVKSGLPWSTKQTMGIIVDFLKVSIGD